MRMNNCKTFLASLGFEDIFSEKCDFNGITALDYEIYGDIYRKNIEVMKVEFHYEFIVDMFLIFNTVFMRSDFNERLESIHRKLDTSLWSELIENEWNTTGDSSIFHLMDLMVSHQFEENIGQICERVCSIWKSQYEEID